MSRGTRAALVVIGILMLFLATVSVNAYITFRADQNWCDALRLLTSKPVTPPASPAADPSREGQYRLYEDFVTIRREFRCLGAQLPKNRRPSRANSCQPIHSSTARIASSTINAVS